MKKTFKLALLPLMIVGLAGCNNKEEQHQYKDDFLYTDVSYEPLDVAHEDQSVTVTSTDLIGTYGGIKAAAWDDYDIKLRVNYSDQSMMDFPVKVINIPIEMRHYLGEVGEQHIYLVEYKWTIAHTFNIIENPDWHGYKCEFYDKDKNYLSTETVGFYEDVKYNGPELPAQQDDYDYHYNFVGWNHPTTYVHQDMQFITKYEKVEKRFYGCKPYNKDHIGIAALVDQDKQRGSGLTYLGRVRHVAAYYGETQELDNADLEFTYPAIDDYGKFWNEYNADIVKYAIEYREDKQYASNIYGNPYDLFNNPNFALQFDSRYDYSGIKAYLDEEGEVTLSKLNPYEGTVDNVVNFVNTHPIPQVISKDDEPGYYRYAVVLSFDVYLSISFNKLDTHFYEIGAFNNFIIAPVTDSIDAIVQYSKDGIFGGNFDEKLIISSEGLYAAAEMIDWSK